MSFNLFISMVKGKVKMKNLKFEIKTIKDNAILLVMFLLKNFTLLTCEAIVQFAIQLDEKIGAMESKMTEVVSEEVSSEEAIEVEDFSEIVEEAMEVEDFSEVVEEVKTSKVKLKDKCIGLAKSAVKYAESFNEILNCNKIPNFIFIPFATSTS